jgi:N-methylhydantoinase A/oxoprolinase/acetone carboxylase beta subunit
VRALGVDVGGTFTDLVFIENGGQAHVGKVPTALASLGQPSVPGLLRSIERFVTGCGHRLSEVGKLEHATTVATNAIIQRSGERTAMVTTEGFRDFLEAGHELLYELYNLEISFPRPLVERGDRIPFAERTNAAGAIVEPVTEAEIDRLAELIRRRGYRSVAICFLHSPRNPTNEVQVARRLTELFPDLHISYSSDVLAEIGEYPRFSTTVIDAYLKPLVSEYLAELNDSLGTSGFERSFGLTLSNGGSSAWRAAARLPSAMVESGPAAGVVALRALQAAGRLPDRLLSFEMGGTTAKLCFIRDGIVPLTRDLEVARVRRFKAGSGLVIAHPSVDLLEIGAGGGSIATLGPDGLPRVGPESAGSHPGPACYGLGGKQPTVTDANLVLGYLEPSTIGFGLDLDVQAAEDAVAATFEPLGLDARDAAAAIYRVVVENMAQAARIAAAERAVDVRAFDLVSCGGAGPMHAAALARVLGIDRVVVPAFAGVMSSLGCLLAPRVRTVVRPVRRPLESVDWGQVRTALDELASEPYSVDDQGGAVATPPEVEVLADMRYRGQQKNRIQVRIPTSVVDAIQAGQDLPAAGGSEIRARFEQAYLDLFGRLVAGGVAEVVDVQIILRWPTSIDLPSGSDTEIAGRPVEDHVVEMYFAGWGQRQGWVTTRQGIACAARPGPGLILDPDTTTVVPPDFCASGADGTLLLTRTDRSANATDRRG